MLKYPLDDMHAKYWTEHKEGVLIALIEQPPEGFQFVGCDDENVFFKKENSSIINYTWKTFLSYPIGSQVALTETWKYCPIRDAVYKADGGCVGCKWINCGFRWQSSVTMPLEAVRHKPVVVEARVARIRELDINPEDCRKAGLASQSASKLIGVRWQNIRDWFNHRFNSPRRKLRYSWEQNPCVEIFKVRENQCLN